MDVLYSDSKTDTKLLIPLYKNSSYSQVSKMLLVDWRLYVACYYARTHTDYHRTKRGMSVGTPVAVNIDFVGTSVLSELYGYSMPQTNFLVEKSCCFIGQWWYFNPHLTPQQATFKAHSVRTVSVSWKNAQLLSTYIYRVLWLVFRRRGDILAPK